MGTDQNCSIATMETVTTTAATATGGTPWSKFALNNQATGKFDYAHIRCFNHVKSDLEKHKEMLKHEYSVLIVSVGVKLLDYLQKLSGPSFFVVWRTNGPSNEMRGANRRHTGARCQELVFGKSTPLHGPGGFSVGDPRPIARKRPHRRRHGGPFWIGGEAAEHRGDLPQRRPEAETERTN
jgi:hypothetical protein